MKQSKGQKETTSQKANRGQKAKGGQKEKQGQTFKKTASKTTKNAEKSKNSPINATNVSKIDFKLDLPKTLKDIPQRPANNLAEIPRATVEDLVFANLIVFFAIALSAFIPIVSISLPLLFFIYFEVGLAGFSLKFQTEQTCHFEDLFVPIKKFARSFCVFVVKFVTVLFLMLLFVVPGVLAFLDFSFCSIILHESNMDARSVLALSKEMTKGFRWKIFFSMLVALLSVCLAMTVTFGVIALFDLFLFVPQSFYVVFVLFAAFLALVLMAMPYVELQVAKAYTQAKIARSIR